MKKDLQLIIKPLNHYFGTTNPSFCQYVEKIIHDYDESTVNENTIDALRIIINMLIDIEIKNIFVSVFQDIIAHNPIETHFNGWKIKINNYLKDNWESKFKIAPQICATNACQYNRVMTLSSYTTYYLQATKSGSIMSLSDFGFNTILEIDEHKSKNTSEYDFFSESLCMWREVTFKKNVSFEGSKPCAFLLDCIDINNLCPTLQDIEKHNFNGTANITADRLGFELTYHNDWKKDFYIALEYPTEIPVYKTATIHASWQIKNLYASSEIDNAGLTIPVYDLSDNGIKEYVHNTFKLDEIKNKNFRALPIGTISKDFTSDSQKVLFATLERLKKLL